MALVQRVNAWRRRRRRRRRRKFYSKLTQGEGPAHGAPAVAVGVRCVIVRRRVQGRLFAAALHRERASFDCVSQE